MDKVEKIVKENQKLRDNIDKMGKIKFEARNVLNDFYNYDKMFSVYVEEIGKRAKRSDLPWLSPQEIIDVLENKEIETSDRDKINWILAKKNNWQIIKGNEAEKILNKFDDYFFNKKADTIKGIVANKGIYRGKVKILRTLFSNKINEEIKKVQKGDILVAETTGPEMMVACKKAGAILTDEGGLTSHAAIISRELGVPCIVGAKISTKVLKDNDEIEVDAYNGIVKIIKRAI